MSDDYKVLFKLDNERDKEHLWEAGCPLMVEAFQLIRNTNTADAYLQVKVRNVFSDVVVNYELEANVEYEDGDTEKLPISVIDGDVPPGGTNQPTPVKLSNPLAVSASVTIKELSLSHGEKWVRTASRADGDMLECELLVLTEKASLERKLQLQQCSFPADDLIYKVATQGESWRCSCGQPNINTELCANCNSKKAILLDFENETYLETMADERGLRETAAKQKSRHRKKVAAIAISIVTVIVVAIGAFLAIEFIPSSLSSLSNEYQIAMDVKSKTRAYKEAAERFEALGGYRDSAYQAEVCRALSKANAAAWQGDGKVHLEEAQKILEPYKEDEVVEKALDSLSDSAKRLN